MYHKGEHEARIKTCEASIGDRNERMINDKIIPGAINFIEKQLFFIVSSMDANGGIVTSVVAGEDGFLQVMDEGTMLINRKLVNSNPYDLFWQNILVHPKVGLLFIELSSRRRFRVNGSIRIENENLVVDVDQAYPNCPKYIQQRHVIRDEPPSYSDLPEQGTALTSSIIDIIRGADTFFVGSADAFGNLDASHRGGSPGFVFIDSDDSLLIPDYNGNSMYNTFGNFLVNPVAGLVFIDFTHYRTLQLTGSVEIIWEKDDPGSVSGGTGWFWRFYPSGWTLLDNLKGYEWNFDGYSPFNPT